MDESRGRADPRHDSRPGTGATVHIRAPGTKRTVAIGAAVLLACAAGLGLWLRRPLPLPRIVGIETGDERWSAKSWFWERMESQFTSTKICPGGLTIAQVSSERRRGGSTGCRFLCGNPALSDVSSDGSELLAAQNRDRALDAPFMSLPMPAGSAAAAERRYGARRFLDGEWEAGFRQGQ